MSKTCPFCQEVKRDGRALYQSGHTIAFLSNPRLMRGHLLIVPKRHVARLAELTPEERHELIETATLFEERILEQLAQGCDLRIHYRPFQKEDGIHLNHLHAHLEPRELFDDLYQKSQKAETALYKPLSEREQQRLTQLFSDIVV